MLIKFKLPYVCEIILNTMNNNHNKNYFEIIENELNNTKNLLDNIPENDYYKLSKMYNPYHSINKILIKDYNFQIVTNAVIKMYELISQFDLIKQFSRKKIINIFCNAELPGGFIIAINHYIKTFYPNKKIKWVASSFIGDASALDDKYNIYKCNKDNWLMDDNMNGDLTSLKNINSIKNKIYDIFPKGVDLYTSDIGIDVSSNFNTQEVQTLLLNYRQILCGLLTLNKNGTMVIKQFTFFTAFNLSLLTLLTNLFQDVYIVKPETSKKINSEIYIVCKNFYNKLNNKLKTYLVNIIPNPDIPIILIDNNVEIELYNISEKIYKFQIENILTLSNSYKRYKNKLNILNKMLHENNSKIQKDWIIHNPIKLIDSNDHISQIC